MRKILYLSIYLLTVSLFTGCNNYSYEEVDNRLTGLDLSELSFTANGGTKTLEVPGNGAVSASVDSSWCQVTVSGKQVSITADTNHRSPNRTAILTIHCDEKQAVIPLTQLGNRFILSTLDLPINCFENTYTISVQSINPITVEEAIDWISDVTIVGNSLSFKVSRNPMQSPARSGVIEVSSGGITQKLTITQSVGVLAYEEFLGTYTMHYTTSNNANSINRNRTATVTLEQAEQGETYYLKGILSAADDSLGNIVVNYDEEKGLEILGQRIFVRSSTNYNFWLMPYCQQPTLNAGNYTGTPNAEGTPLAIGMITADFSSEGIGFVLKDNGYWPSSTASNTTYGPLRAAGFVLRNYEGSTNRGNVNGRDGQAFIYFPLFEKQ